MLSVQATYHQGQSKSVGSGRQCAANSLIAMAIAMEKVPNSWSTTELDNILEEGDKLYSSIGSTNNLMICELPQTVMKYNVEIKQSYCGTVTREKTDIPFYNLYDSLKNMLQFCFLTISCYTIAIIKSDQWFYVFDSHSRNDCGMPSADGKAVVTGHSSLKNLIIYIRHLSARLSNKVDQCFEVTHVFLSEVSNISLPRPSESSHEFEYLTPSTCSEFSGFSAVSDGEYSCILQMIDESFQSCLLKIQNCDDSVSAVGESDVDVISESDGSDVSDVSCEIDTVRDTNVRLDNARGREARLLNVDGAGDKEIQFESVGDKVKEAGDRESLYEVHIEDNYDEPDMYTAVRLDDYVEGKNVGLESEVRLHEIDVGIGNVDIGRDNVGSLEDCIDKDCKVGLDDCEQGKASDDREEQQFCETESSFIDEAITDLDNSAVFLQSIDLNTFTDSDSDTVDYVLSENDIEDNMPLSFVAKKGKRYNKIRFQRELNRQVEINNDTENVPESTNQQGGENHIIRSRKRMRNESNWRRNINKRQRNEGKKFVNKHKKVIPERRLKPTCGVTCRFKCTQNFTITERETVLHSYWKLGCPTRQRQFLLKFSNKCVKARGSVHSHKQNSVKYFLPHLDSNKIDRVCKVFFLHTLDISHTVCENAHIKTQLPGVSAKDRRGKSDGSRSNKTSEDALNTVRDHIKSFPAVESHYCRKDSQRQYLDPSLSLRAMYNLYINYCSDKDLEKVKIHTYRRVFNTEFNISFHKPLKDQCDLCTSFKQASEEDKEKLYKNYCSHIRNCKKARENKEVDKSYAKQNSDVTVACFDLEEVLITPKGFVSSMYYKHRLSTYNFTIYNLGNSEAHSYVWNETIASRGACEVASCVYNFIEQKCALGCKRFVFFSDNCYAQNKNKYYVSMLWYSLQKFDIEYITHKYLEKGHTFNENDSVHAAIETAARHLTIYTTDQWAATIHAARHTKPYTVLQMSLSDFFDFKGVSELLKNFDLNEQREKVYISETRIIQVSSTQPNKYSYKYDYEDAEFGVVNLTTRVRRTNETVPNPKTYHLKQLRDELLPISLIKYNDLIALCLEDVIPSPNHAFFVLLPHQTE